MFNNIEQDKLNNIFNILIQDKIHDIEVVIDRLPVTADMKLRLSQSVQKTLQMGKDLLFVSIEDSEKVFQFSKQLMAVIF